MRKVSRSNNGGREEEALRPSKEEVLRTIKAEAYDLVVARQRIQIRLAELTAAIAELSKSE